MSFVAPRTSHILTDHHDDGESSRSRFRVQLASRHHVTNKPEKLADVHQLFVLQLLLDKLALKAVLPSN